MLLPLHLNGLNLDSGTAVATITGTASSGLTEAEIVSGGQTIIITLTNDTFLAFNDTIRQAIIDGLDSAQSETTGWNAEVRDKEVVSAVVRDSDTQVTITLSAAASYDVTADETITVTVPASALTGGSALTASPTIAVTAAVATKGGRRRRKKPRYLVEIDGQFFDADNIAAVQAVLSQAIDTAPQAAKVDADKAPPKVRIKPPKIKVTTASGAQTTSQVLQRSIRAAQERVNAIYRKAQSRLTEIRETAAAVEIQRERERRNEEEAIISLLL